MAEQANPYYGAALRPERDCLFGKRAAPGIWRQKWCWGDDFNIRSLRSLI